VKLPAELSDPCDILGTVERISVSPLFIGRSAELSALNLALKRAGNGQPQAVLIGGEAGVGKTRLLEEFQYTVGTGGAVVAVGGCLEVGAEGLPYAPFATILRRLQRELGAAEMEQAAEGHESSLARLLPDFGEAAPESHDEFARARLFEHAARLFERLSTNRVLVLAVEDLHWSDRSTRELLAYLVRTLHRARVVIIGTYRSDDLHRRHPVRPYLAELERLRTVQRLELPRLAQREVARQLAGIMRPSVPDRELVGRIYERSEGNPFFVEELAVCYQQGARGLTDSLRDLLLVRVEALPEETQAVLRVLAEGGSTVEHGLLSVVLGLSEDELIDNLRIAVGANIIQPSGDCDGYRFRHALVREAVSDDLMPGERSRINRRYATALAADHGLVCRDQATARLADYWFHAHDAARALPAALDAGQEARRRNAFAEQLGMLDRAIGLWDDVPEEVLRSVRPYDWAEETYPPCSCDPGACDEDCRRLRLSDVLAEATVAARLSGGRDQGPGQGRLVPDAARPGRHVRRPRRTRRDHQPGAAPARRPRPLGGAGRCAHPPGVRGHAGCDHPRAPGHRPPRLRHRGGGRRPLHRGARAPHPGPAARQLRRVRGGHAGPARPGRAGRRDRRRPSAVHGAHQPVEFPPADGALAGGGGGRARRPGAGPAPRDDRVQRHGDARQPRRTADPSR
jgi:hypothetical protein